MPTWSRCTGWSAFGQRRGRGPARPGQLGPTFNGGWALHVRGPALPPLPSRWRGGVKIEQAYHGSVVPLTQSAHGDRGDVGRLTSVQYPGRPLRTPLLQPRGLTNLKQAGSGMVIPMHEQSHKDTLARFSHPSGSLTCASCPFAWRATHNRQPQLVKMPALICLSSSSMASVATSVSEATNVLVSLVSPNDRNKHFKGKSPQHSYLPSSF
jgi:hypothetical protein